MNALAGRRTCFGARISVDTSISADSLSSELALSPDGRFIEDVAGPEAVESGIVSDWPLVCFLRFAARKTGSSSIM